MYTFLFSFNLKYQLKLINRNETVNIKPIHIVKSSCRKIELYTVRMLLVIEQKCTVVPSTGKNVNTF